MVPLRANFALRRNALWPMDDHPVAGAAIARRPLLGPCERRVPRNGPAGGIMAVRLRSAEVVIVLQYVLNGLRDPVEIGHLIEEAVHAPFGARAIVADDVEDQRIVELTCRLDRFD